MNLLRLSEACAMIRITPGCYKKLKEKPFPAFKPPGRSWLYVWRIDVEVYLKRCEVLVRQPNRKTTHPDIQKHIAEVLLKHESQ